MCKVKDELTRNWRENNDAQESQCVKVVGLFAQFCHLKNVTCLNLKNEYLFQRPKKGADESDKVWYDNMVVGQRTLGEKMKKLPIEAKLSGVYMNHSIRATMITKLDESGYEAQHIMAVSGHRNESSIRSYSSQTSLSTTRKMSETLSESLNNKKTVNHSEIPAAESALQPLLTASQEEHIFNELSIEQSNTQKTVNNFYNCSFNFES